MLMQAGRNDAADTVERMAHYEEVFWKNPCCEQGGEDMGLDTEGAEKRLQRFAPYIKNVFPETDNGIIESPLIDISKMKERLFPVKGRLLLKEDSDLPISGSVKARGGIYEVLKTAETIAVRSGMLSEEDDYAVMADQRFRELFSQYKVAVGSTGNLGLSIGIAGAAMGFKTVVHMSSDAREWKKELLREKALWSESMTEITKRLWRRAEWKPLRTGCAILSMMRIPRIFWKDIRPRGRALKSSWMIWE